MKDNRENAIIRLEGLGEQFQTSDDPVTALEDISLEIHNGKVFGIIGLSGAGKNTLVRCINYLEVPTSGKIIFEGKDLSVMKDRERRLARRSIGMIFQQFSLLTQRNVLQNVCSPLGIAGIAKGEAKKRTEEPLRLAGLRDRMKACLTRPSGGRRQRATIARAMATNPKVLLCNEVASILGPNTTKSILELLKKVNKGMGITVIVIIHGMAVIEAICNRVATIDHSHIIGVGKMPEISSDPKFDIGRQLTLGDVTIQKISLGASRQIRIMFNGREFSEPMIANVVLACKVPMNVMYADTRDIKGKVMGQTVIRLPEDDTNAGRICNYLKAANVASEEVRRDAV